MVFSSYFLLIPFALFLMAFVLFGIINIFNLIKYGGATFAGLFATLCFIASTAFIVYLTFNQLSVYDWNEPVALFENFNNSGFLEENSF